MTKREWVQELALRLSVSYYERSGRDLAYSSDVLAVYASDAADAIEKKHPGFFDSPPYINRGPG